MVNNPSFYSQTALADTSSITQITDGADFPHSGLIKALADGLGQNYAISGFNITPTNATQGSVATGSIMRDGKIVTVSSALNFTLTTTYTSGSDYGYHLIVVNSSDALALRTPTASNKVPHPTSGDTIVAVLTHTGTNPFNAQYLTVDKDENSVTIARNNSGTYTESLTIQSNAGDVTIKALEQNKDIIFNVNDGGTDTEVMRIDGQTSRLGVLTNSPQKHLHIRGADPTIRLQEDSENGYLELAGKSENQGQIRLTNLNTAANESATLDIEAYSSGDNAQTIRMFRLANTPTNAVTSFQILKPNTTNFAFKVIADSGNTTIASGAYLQAPRLNTATLNSDTTLSESSHAGLYLFVTGSSRTITLPNTHGAGVHFTLLSNDANGFTLTSTDNMNGASDDISVSARDGVTCISDGTDWVVLGA